MRPSSAHPRMTDGGLFRSRDVAFSDVGSPVTRLQPPGSTARRRRRRHRPPGMTWVKCAEILATAPVEALRDFDPARVDFYGRTIDRFSPVVVFETEDGCSSSRDTVGWPRRCEKAGSSSRPKFRPRFPGRGRLSTRWRRGASAPPFAGKGQGPHHPAIRPGTTERAVAGSGPGPPAAFIADGLARLQVRYPEIPVVFADSRKFAEEWTYRFLAAALTYAMSGT